MVAINLLGTLTNITANFINPYDGSLLTIDGDYYINDTFVTGSSGTFDILLGTTHNQYYRIEDEFGNLLIDDNFELILPAPGDDIVLLASSTYIMGDLHIQGSNGDDFIWSGAGNDIVNGGYDNDVVNGGLGDDIIIGDVHDDILMGGAGDDTYRFELGDGVDIITEFSGFDVISFTDATVLSDLVFTQVGDDLRIDIGGLGDEVTVINFYDGVVDHLVEEIQFSDSSTFDLTSLIVTNNAPDAVDDAFSGDEDTVITGNVLGNDSDPDVGDSISAIANTLTTINGAIVTLLADGSFTYDPAADFYGVDSFDYTITDLGGLTDTASVTVNVLPVDEVLNGTNGDDTLIGSSDNDIIDGLEGSDLVSGGLGNDTLIYSNDAVWTSGLVAWNVGAPDAIINGDRVTVAPRYRSHDGFDGGDGTDTIQMGDDGDAIFLDDRYSSNPFGYNTARIIDVEIIRAGEGNDIVDLTSKQFSYGDVSIYGDAGDDVLWGNAGDDYIEGGTGNDHLDGASGDDTLVGGSGDDKMYGWSGDDIFIIGEGADELYSGTGSDIVIFDMIDAFIDIIHDFTVSDALDISNILVGYDPLTDLITDFVQITDNGTDSYIAVDIDGGADNFVQVAIFTDIIGLTDEADLVNNGNLII